MGRLKKFVVGLAAMAGLFAVALQGLAADAPGAEDDWPTLQVLPELPRHDAECVMPSWPPSTREKVHAEDLKLYVRVGADGTVKGIRVEQSSGFKEIDQLVTRALFRCRFTPAAVKNKGSVEAVSALMYRWADNQLVRTPAPRVLAALPKPEAPARTTPCVAFDPLTSRLRHGVQGFVQLRLGYDESGKIASAEVVKGSGSAALDEGLKESLIGCPAESVLGSEAKPQQYSWEWELVAPEERRRVASR